MNFVRCCGRAVFGDHAGISAQHAFAAEYDENKRVTISGTVTGIKWTNPHAWLYVDGKDESDKVKTAYELEHSPHYLRKSRQQNAALSAGNRGHRHQDSRIGYRLVSDPEVTVYGSTKLDYPRMRRHQGLTCSSIG